MSRLKLSTKNKLWSHLTTKKCKCVFKPPYVTYKCLKYKSLITQTKMPHADNTEFPGYQLLNAGCDEKN